MADTCDLEVYRELSSLNYELKCFLLSETLCNHEAERCSNKMHSFITHAAYVSELCFSVTQK